MTSYDVDGANASFERVSVRYENVDRPDDPSAVEVVNDTDARGSADFANDHGASDEWNVTVRTIYADEEGREYVAAERSVRDVADAANPDGNDDLARDGSPSVDRYDPEDRSNPGRGPRYRLDYEIGDAAEFDRVEGAAIGLDGGGAAFETSEREDGTVELRPGYGYEGEFKLALLVFDDDGAVVAAAAERDEADGSDP
ncbi:hypothetical protein [Halegenticoccus tardaugens]|uniref:hypothetical protein n=1 Tax=Halegenticoccus tardaugens TaxID=2071624 RepID=UPI00100C26F5|nr:hypothetical protein [Halegenticoccus tardaugens]